jgi:hypothetical protein
MDGVGKIMEFCYRKGIASGVSAKWNGALSAGGKKGKSFYFRLFFYITLNLEVGRGPNGLWASGRI